MTSHQMFINNALSIIQNTNMYGTYFNESSIYDYIFSINISSFAPNISSIFNVATFTQNTLNNDDVNINLSIDKSNVYNNWNNIFNNKPLVQVVMGQSTTGFGTLRPTIPNTIGDRLLEVVALKLFGHGQAHAAINNDNEFYTHDAQLWDHLSNSVAMNNIKHDIFNQYVASGRYEIEIAQSDNFTNITNDINITDNININEQIINFNNSFFSLYITGNILPKPSTSDVNGDVVNFNFDGFSFDFPLYITGNIITDISLTSDELNMIQNGPDVGGSRLINGSYNIPILVKFH